MNRTLRILIHALPAFLASAASLADAAGLALSTPQPQVPIAHGAYADVPIVIANDDDATTRLLEVYFLANVAGLPYHYTQRSQPDCGEFTTDGLGPHFTTPGLAAHTQRTCIVRISRDEGDNDSSQTTIFARPQSPVQGDSSATIYIRVGSFADTAIASEFLSRSFDEQGVAHARFRLTMSNNGDTDIGGARINVGVCHADPPVGRSSFRSDFDGGCMDAGDVACGDASQLTVQMPAIQAGNSYSCLVEGSADTYVDDISSAYLSGLFDSGGGTVFDTSEDNDNPTLPVYGEGIAADRYGLSGSWVTPANSGQGIVLAMQPDAFGANHGLLFGGWFTFDPFGSGAPRWYTLQAETHGERSPALTIYQTTGGSLDSAQPTTTTTVDGESFFEFNDCNHAKLHYGSEVIPLMRLLSDVACESGSPPANEPGYALQGIWADPSNSGQGIVFDVDTHQHVLFGAWYTFAFNAPPQQTPDSQSWYTLQAAIVPGTTTVDTMTIYETTGGAFIQPAPILTRDVGTAQLVLHDCNSATLDYWFTDPSGLRHGSLDLARLGVPPPGCAL